MHRHLWYKKLSRAGLLALLATAMSCSKGQRKNDVLIPEAPSNKETALVDTGFSAQGVFSPDGTRLLFVSKERKSHAHYQVYEKDLRSGDENRITFQNGDTYFPRYHAKEPWILYSSSTDELKENPPLLQENKEPLKGPERFQLPLEIYMHSLKDYQIVRITDRMGFDGEAQFTPNGDALTWTRAKDQRSEVVTMKRLSKTPQVMKGLGPNPSQFNASKDGKWREWLDADETFGVAKLKIQNGKNPAVELTPDAIVPKTDMIFSPDSKYLLWSQLDLKEGVYQIWAADLESACAQRLTTNGKDDGDRRYPALSPDMKVLIYTAVAKKRSRIMQVSWTAPSATCATTP